MKKIFTLVFLLVCMLYVYETCGQNPLPKYQRSSLHMILLTTDEPALVGESDDFSKNIETAWQSYPFPDKYDQHKIDFVTGYGGKPKGTINELITRFQTGLSGLSIKDLKELSENLSGNKKYNAFLADTTQIMLREQKVGQMLLRKWYNIADDGSWSVDLISERGAYNATQANIADATSTMQFGAFIDLLSDCGVTEAIYTDMGYGWNYSWYRLFTGGQATYIHKQYQPAATNWLVFYSK